MSIVLKIILSHPFSRGGQFRHSRLKDGANLEVSNPVYMPQTTEEEEDESRQPLDQPYDFDPEKVSTASRGLLLKGSKFFPLRVESH